MKKVCIDTNIYIAYKKGDSAVTSILEEAEELLVPAVVLGELFAGFYLGNKTKKNLAELEEFLSLPGVETVDVTQGVAEKYGYLVKMLKEQGSPIPTNDIWVAASALETAAKLMSHDKHFQKVPGIILVN